MMEQLETKLMIIWRDKNICSDSEHAFNTQESCAIAKTTARCALYMGYSTI